MRPTTSFEFCFIGTKSEAYSSAIDLEILQKKCLEFVRIEAFKKGLRTQYFTTSLKLELTHVAILVISKDNSCVSYSKLMAVAT